MKNKPWLVFDKETDSFDGSPVEAFIYGIVYHTGEEFVTYDRDYFIQKIKEFDGIALAHNGGKFDTVLMADEFNIGQEIKLINGRVAEVQIGKCTVRDSFLIIPAPLSASGKKDQFDYSILDRNKKHLRKKHKAEIEKYLLQDCRALAELVRLFYESYGQRLTQAGAALATWENMGGFPRRWGGIHDKLFRRFYYGGRCEAFQKGYLGDGWQYFDIKSAYPYAMQHEHTCCRIENFNVCNSIKKITPQSFCKIVASSAGCLPVKGKYVTEYPRHDDKREYYATGWEVLTGMETGTLKVYEAVIYTPETTETLKPYVDKYYAEKAAAEKAGDSVKRLMAKIFLNSLYGKFGQCADDFKKYWIADAGEEKSGYSLYQECEHFDIVQKPSGGQFYDVALSASITGFTRAFLWRQICASKDVAYCDTDSIMSRGGKFDIGENIGQWEKVCNLDHLHIAGKKLYTGFDGQDWVSAHKGFSKLDTSHEDIIAAANGDTILIDKKAPSINVLGAQRFISRTMKRT